MDPSAVPQTTVPGADAAEARREARRRRILENSSNRLAKISGHETTQESSDTAKNSNTSASGVTHDDPEMERDIYEPRQFVDPMQQFLSGGGGGGGAAANPQADLFNSLFMSMNNGDGLGGIGADGGANNPFAMFQGFANASTLDAPLLTGGLFAGMQSPSGEQQATAQAAAPVSLFVRVLRAKLHIAAIGVLTYLLAANDLMFRSHVFTLFLLWEAFEMFVLKPYEKTAGGSFLVIGFLFLGIPSEHSTVLMRWMATGRRVLKDVAVFVFFFVAAHLLWQRLVFGEPLAAILNIESATDAVAQVEFARAHVRQPAAGRVVDTEPEMEFEF